MHPHPPEGLAVETQSGQLRDSAAGGPGKAALQEPPPGLTLLPQELLYMEVHTLPFSLPSPGDGSHWHRP